MRCDSKGRRYTGQLWRRGAVSLPSSQRNWKMRADREHPNARNFGLQNRDMRYAAKNALREQYQSHSTIATLTDRFRVFADYLKQVHSIQDMRRIEVNHVQEYAQLLNARVQDDSLKPATAQNYLSAVNCVMRIARGDNELNVRPVHDAGMQKRIHEPGIDKSQLKNPEKLNQLPERFRMNLELAKQFGMRFEESAKLNCQQALIEAQEKKQLTISLGVKGGNHDRLVPVVSDKQIETLKQAVLLQGSGRSLISPGENYRQYQNAAQQYGINYHAGRHEYAQNRYQQLTGVACPVKSGIRHGVTHIRYIASQLGISEARARQLDRAARLTISRELGHERISITGQYLN